MQFLSKAMVLFWVSTILVASTCFGADVHYCKGEVKTFGIYEAAKPCKMHDQKPVEEAHACCKARTTVEQQPQKGFPVAKNGKCCHNDQVAFKTEKESQESNVEFQLVQLEKVDQFFSEYSTYNWNNFSITNPPFRGPPDDLKRRNLQVFFQVFRI